MKLCCCCFFLSVDAKLFRFFSSRFRMIAIKITTKKWRSEFDRSWRNKKLERTNRTWRILNKWSGPTEGNFILWERKTIITLWGLTTGMLPVCNHSRIEFACCTKSVIFAYLKRVRVKMSYRSLVILAETLSSTINDLDWLLLLHLSYHVTRFVGSDH